MSILRWAAKNPMAVQGAIGGLAGFIGSGGSGWGAAAGAGLGLYSGARGLGGGKAGKAAISTNASFESRVQAEMASRARATKDLAKKQKGDYGAGNFRKEPGLFSRIGQGMKQAGSDFVGGIGSTFRKAGRQVGQGIAGLGRKIAQSKVGQTFGDFRDSITGTARKIGGEFKGLGSSVFGSFYAAGREASQRARKAPRYPKIGDMSFARESAELAVHRQGPSLSGPSLSTNSNLGYRAAGIGAVALGAGALIGIGSHVLGSNFDSNQNQRYGAVFSGMGNGPYGGYR